MLVNKTFAEYKLPHCYDCYTFYERFDLTYSGTTTLDT